VYTIGTARERRERERSDQNSDEIFLSGSETASAVVISLNRGADREKGREETEKE
jgi:hypothetical protein